MTNEIQKLSEPLPIESIDFRVQSINKGGYATILAYKDARVDMQRLDDVVGALNWKREHTRDNRNCIVSIYNEETKEWVGKEDTGTESSAEQQKGLASDSFKRACFNWGIGRELYDYPFIQIKLNQDEFTIQGDKAKQTYNLKIKEWKWLSEFKDGVLISLSCVDTKGAKRFTFRGNKPPVKEQPKPTEAKPELKPEEPVRWNAAVKFINEGQTVAQIKKHYLISKVNEEKLLKEAK